ncbi:MAG TPA: hypothetical protein VG711_06160 [Phycisphaerales bacterium]|nr:hypothetical protein [Phycisphaerales bacterium]
MVMHVTRSFLSTFVLAASATLAVYSPASPMVSPAHAEGAEVDAGAQAVLDQAVEALGGKDAISKIKSMQAEMSMQANGMDVQMMVAWSRDGGRYMKANTKMGQMVQGTDGTTMWMQAGMGVQTLTNKEQAKQLDQQASMFMNYLEPKHLIEVTMKSVTSGGKKPFNGKDCDCLHFVNLDGQEGDMYFDAATHLPEGSEVTMGVQGATSKVSRIMSEWEAENGVQFCRTFVFSLPHAAEPMMMKVTKIELNNVDDSLFAKPKDEAPAGAHPMSGHPSATQPAGTKPAGSQPDAGAAAGGEIKLEDLTPDQQAKAKQMLENVRKANDIDSTKQMVQRLEPMLGMMPADQKPMMEYIVQELKKDIAKAGG